jgi:phthiocerol/phenolphthiocerol synthesis type-I polyketide synthase D
VTDSSAAAAEIERFLVAELADRLELDPALIDPRRPLERYGLDSLNALRLAAELESRIGRRLPTTLLWDHPTIESLSKYLVNELNVSSLSPRANQ